VTSAAANPGAVTRRLGATVLAGEAAVLFFFGLAASRLRPDDALAIAVVSAVGAVTALALCGLLRHRAALWASWLLQAGLIAAGVLVPMMYGVGALFAILWFIALRLAAKAELVAAARSAEERSAGAGPLRR
jgi:hypothetical protein